MFNLKKGALLLGVFGSVLLMSACNPFITDNQVLEKMMEQSSKVESSTIDAIIKIGIPSEIGDGALVLNAKGKYALENLQDKANFHYIYDYNLGISASYAGTTFTGDADLLQTDKKMYVKVNNVPLLPMFDLDAYKNQWYSIDFEQMMAEAGVSNMSSSIDWQEMNGLMVEMNDLMMESKFLTVKDDLGKTKIGDNKVYHFQLELDKPKFQALLIKVMEKINTASGEELALDASMKAEMTAGMDEVFKVLNIKNIEVYIDTDTFDLRRMVLVMEMTVPESTQSATVEMDMTMDNFNQIKISDIAIPAESKDLYQMYMEEKTKMMELEALESEDVDVEISDEELFGDIQADEINGDELSDEEWLNLELESMEDELNQ